MEDFRHIGIAGLENLSHGFGGHTGTEWEVAGGDALGQRHHIWLNALMTRARPVTDSTKSRDQLISIHQEAVARTDIAHQPHGGHVGHDAPSCALNRHHNESCDGVRALKHNLIDYGLRAELRQLGWVDLVERIAIGIGRSDVETARQNRFVFDAEAVVAVE